MNRKELANCLELMKPALADSDIIPMFTNYYFEENTVKAYNDTLGISADLSEKIKSDGGFGVKGSTLLGLLKNSKAPDLTFDFDDEFVLVKAGRSKIKLPYMKDEEFIFSEAEPDKTWPITLKINGDVLNGIEACLITTSRDNSLPGIMGITISSKKKLNFYSCDGDAITRYTIGKSKCKEAFFMMPNEFCDTLLKISHKTKCSSGTIYVNEEWACAVLKNGYKIYGRIIENPDPLDHEALLKRTIKGTPEFVKKPKGIIEALARAMVVADGSNTATQATVKGGKLVMVTDAQTGVVRDALRLTGHPDIEGLINAKAMHRSLNLCDKMAIMDNCTIYTNGENLFSLLSNMGQ